MKKFKSFILRTLAFTIVFVISLSLVVNAETSLQNADIPYDHFVYYTDANTKLAVQVRGMYNLGQTLDANTLGLGSFSSLTDVAVDSEDNVYLLDGAASKIFMLDPECKPVRTIEKVVSPEEEYTFKNAAGMVVSADGKIYIADSDNKRVLICDKEGNYISAMFLPESKLIPDGFEYRPVKIAVDSSGYVYVLSDGSYYGAILYSPDGEFLGFYGANTVVTSITQVLQKIWNMIIMTNERHAYTMSKLPYQFTDLYADKQDFIYTATGSTGAKIDQGQIKRMNPGGTNVLESKNVTFGFPDAAVMRSKYIYPDIAGLAVNDGGFIATYDSMTGHIFIYDNDCIMMDAFSGGSLDNGYQDGTFALIKAIDMNSKSDIFVIDALKLSLTVFKLNDFGRKYMKADTLTRDGDYGAVLPLWHEVLSQDRNCIMAYTGIAKSYLQVEDYANALKYAKLGFDKDTYSSAFEYVRRDYLDANLTWIFIVLIILTVGLVIFSKYKKKHNIVFIKNEEIKLLLNVVFHPSDVFNEVKQKKKGSVWLGVILIVVYYITATLKSTVSGFLFVSSSSTSFNSLLVLLQTSGLVILWTVSNWAVCTLMQGKGKMREIFIVASYSLLPMIFGNIIYTLLSHVLVTSESPFLSIIVVVLELLTGIILITGTMIVHDYSFGKFVGTALLTLFGILVILFLLIAVFILVQQLWSFLGTIYRELFFRVN